MCHKIFLTSCPLTFFKFRRRTVFYPHDPTQREAASFSPAVLAATFKPMRETAHLKQNGI